MGICWYCYWGWPKTVKDIFDFWCEKLGGDDSALCYGPGHIVWDDENFGTESIQWCLREFDEHASELIRDVVFTRDEMEIVRESLKQLLAVPSEIRDPYPEDYDDAHPEKYPPPPGVEMAKI